MAAQPRSRRLFSATFLGVIGFLILVVSTTVIFWLASDEVRRISDTSVDARLRGRFIKAPVMLVSVAPSADSVVEIIEAWVEQSVRLRLRWWVWPTRVPTTQQALVLRVHPGNARARVGVLGADGLRDTIWLGQWFYASPHLLVALRQSPMPDTLYFVEEPRRKRTRKASKAALLPAP